MEPSVGHPRKVQIKGGRKRKGTGGGGVLWAAGGGGGRKGNVGVRFISCALWFLMTLLPRVTVGLGNLATLRRKGPKVSTSTPHHHHPHTHTHPSQQRCVGVIEVAADFQTFLCWHGNRNLHPPPHVCGQSSSGSSGLPGWFLAAPPENLTVFTGVTKLTGELHTEFSLIWLADCV